MIDWLAMMVASVASTISGSSRGGAQGVEDVIAHRPSVEQQRGLPRIVEDQAGEDQPAPREADRPGAEMAHIGIERLGPGDTEEHAAQQQKALPAMAEQIAQSMQRIDRGQHAGMVDQAGQPQHGDGGEPQQHHRAEGMADAGRTQWLQQKKDEQNGHRQR
jgi:hypothetical protein